MPRRSPLTVAVHLVLGALLTPAAWAADSAADESPADPRALPEIVVSALALGEDADQIASPYSIVGKDKLTTSGAATLGDVLNGLPGVHADTFGGGASRPVVRGQTAPRVKVLSDGASVLDASDVSPDHAVMVDPLLAERVEVLRGPATLLYGSGAVGGVVNILDNKIPTALPVDGIDGSLAVRGNTVARERAAAAAITAQLGSSLVLHAEVSARDANDYRVPDWDERRVDGSFAESNNASVGLSWISPRGYVGMAYSYRDDDYGLPGHNHEYEGCHPHGSALHCGEHGDGHAGGDDGHGHEHGHEAPPTVDVASKRLDVRGEYTDPFGGFERIRFRASDTRYRHHEREEDEIATTFRNEGQEARVELQHVPLGRWSGVVGVQHSDTRFSADGEEAFLPIVDTRTTGVFAVEHVQLSEAWHLELGARHEWLEHKTVDDPRNRPDFDDTATSFSGAAIWQFVPGYAVTVSAARSERLPHAQELYARGVHLATNTYECGLLPSVFTCGGAVNDRAFGIETSRNVEVGLRKTEGDVTFSVSAYRNNVDDYIYARTLDRFEDFRLIKYTQADARFRGVEAELTYRFSDTFSATVFGDRVRATLADGGGNLPRIPAKRAGLRLDGEWDRFGSELAFYRVAKQDDIADFETESAGYTMLDLTLSYQLGDNRNARVYLRGSNLLDEQVWNHASFLASAVPLPGRNFTAGLRYDF